MFFNTQPNPAITLDNRWSRGADMLVGRKPTGPVVLDRQHPAAPDSCLLFNEASGPVTKDHGTGTLHPISTDCSWVVQNGRVGLLTLNADDYIAVSDVVGDLYMLSFATLWNQQDYDTVQQQKLVSFGPSLYLYSGPQTSYLTNEVFFLWGSVNGRTGVVGSGLSWPGDEYTHVVVWWNGANYEMWVNGIRQAVTAGTQGHAALISITAYEVRSSATTVVDFTLDHSYVYTRPVSEGVAESVARNPYQFLKPGGN